MRLITQIYIDTIEDINAEPNYQRLELFDFESIEITSSIQEVRDISAIFTDFSQQFSIPASKTNNKALKHFYSLSLLDGFDARIKRRGYISLNGIPFRSGFFRLSEAKIKNGKPYSYSLTFFGAMVNLKDVLGESELKDLGGLSKFNHVYSETNVFRGFTNGYGLDANGQFILSNDRDLIYPAISAVNKWSYDSSGSSDPVAYNQGLDANIFYDGVSNATRGISFTQLKPAIKLIRIIEAIEEQYDSLTFSRDFFGTDLFNGLYMLLHNVKGELPNALALEDEVSADPLLKRYIIAPKSTGIATGRFNPDSGQTELRPFITNEKELEGKDYNFTLSITNAVPATGKYTLRAYADGQLLNTLVNVEGDSDLTFNLTSELTKEWNNVYVEVEAQADELTSYSIDLSIETTFTDTDINGNTTSQTVTSNYVTPQSTETILSEIIISKFIPKMKILEFLKGIFKMFNLTAYVEDGIIMVKTLNDFYLEGADRDISLDVDTSDISIKRAELFNQINFEFSEPTTFGILNQNEVAQDDYGNLDYKADEGSLIFDGAKYEVKLPFEKLYYERLSDENDLTLIGNDRPTFGYGWLVDKDQEATITKPIIFFNVPTEAGAFPFGFKGEGQFTLYNRPSNITENGNLSLHFNAEIDNYRSELIINSLFSVFYEGYIANLFDKTTRIVDYRTILKLSTLLTYKMNDRMFVNGNPFRINSIKTNLNTGVSDLELLTDYNPVELTVDNDLFAPTAPTDLTATSISETTIDISWTPSIDNLAVTNYDIYKDNVFLTTLANVTSYQLTGLLGGIAYDIEVVAIDGAGNQSDKSNVLTVTTLASPDVVAPTAPTNLALYAALDTSIVFTWTESFDLVGVTNYNIYVNTVLVDVIGNVTSYELTGLTESTSYSVQVSALDAANNESDLTPVVLMTTVSSDFEAPTQPTNLTEDFTGINRINISWTASIDNVAVTGYKVYVDANPAIDTLSTDTSYSLTGLLGATSYSISVSAYDAEGNESIKSAVIIATTL